MKKDRPLRPGSPDFYRKRAAEMQRLAEQAASSEARLSFLSLANAWGQLAQQVEHPGW